jgi:methylthioribulose-1-phosphate dehydratase
MSVAAAPALGRRLARLAESFWRRGWMLGTSGNLSARLPGAEPCFVITASGRPKGRLGPGDFLLLGPEGRPLRPSSGRPSDEAPIHLELYRRRPELRAVLHVHAPHATLVSDTPEAAVELRDLEMLKGLGLRGPFGALQVPVVPNDADAGRVAEHLAGLPLQPCPGALVRGHGLYAWGRSLEEAERHVEIFEFLFEQLVLRGRLRK